MRLVQMPDGNWLCPNHVLTIEANREYVPDEEDSQYDHAARPPSATVRLNWGSRAYPTESYDQACALRNAIAASFNIMLDDTGVV